MLRGCVYDPLQRAVSESVDATFGYAEAQVVSFADLYAGKLVAALDRQHPRDLFDVRDLLANEGIDDQLRRSFVVYLISHNRPMHELLAPVRKSITGEFERGFVGMTDISIRQSLDPIDQDNLRPRARSGLSDAGRFQPSSGTRNSASNALVFQH